MNFNKNDLWTEETELLNLNISKLARAKVLLNLEFDTKDQVLFPLYSSLHIAFAILEVIRNDFSDLYNKLLPHQALFPLFHYPAYRLAEQDIHKPCRFLQANLNFEYFVCHCFFVTVDFVEHMLKAVLLVNKFSDSCLKWSM